MNAHSPLTWFEVYLDGQLLDEVPLGRSASYTAEELRRSLVERDGYDPRIEVVQSWPPESPAKGE